MTLGSRLSPLLIAAALGGCQPAAPTAPMAPTASAKPIAVAASSPIATIVKAPLAPPLPSSMTLTDTAPPEMSSSAPATSPAIPLDKAVAGLRGKGPLVAKLEIDGGTVKGTFTCELYDDKAPLTVANFVALARGLRSWKDKSGQFVKKPLYDGTIFHRVIPDFMIQGGDPDGNGRGGPGYEFGDEFGSGLTFDKPALLAMANKGPGTNGSQFFITEGTPTHLNGHHTIFGLCDPLDLVKKIARVDQGPGNRPNTPVVLKKVTIQRGKK